MADEITSETIQQAIRLDFQDNQYLRQIKGCIRQDQQQFFVIICRELEQNLINGELIYRFQTLRLCKVLVELKNDTFNYNHFSINVLPHIANMTSERFYTESERNQVQDRMTINSLIQLGKEVIRGWAYLFPQLPDVQGEPILSEFLKTYLRMSLGDRINFPPYQYYPLQIIETHKHPNYEHCEARWREDNQLIDTNLVSKPEGTVEQLKKQLEFCQKLLQSTQDQLKYVQNNYTLSEEKVKAYKTENCDLFKQLLAEKKKKKQTPSDPNENILLVSTLQRQNQHINDENIELGKRNSDLERRTHELLQEMGKMQEQYQNQIQQKELEIFALKQKIEESNETLLNQYQNQEQLSEQLQNVRRSRENTSSENVSLAWHKLEIEAKSIDYEQKLLAAKMEIRQLQYQIKVLKESEIYSSKNNQFQANELQQLNNNHIKTIREQQETINKITNQNHELERQISNLNSQKFDITREKNQLQQDLLSQKNNYESKLSEKENEMTELKKKYSILQEKYSLEKDTLRLISASSPTNLKVRQVQLSVVDFNTLQPNHQYSQKINGFRSLNQSVQQSFRNNETFSDSPSPQARYDFPEKFEFTSNNQIQKSIQPQQIKLNLIHGNGIFHSDNYFQFARQSKIQDQKLQCRIYLKNISANQIRDLKVKYNCSQNNLQFQPFTNSKIKSDLISGEQASFMIKEIHLSDIIQKRQGIIIALESLNFKNYQIQIQLALTSLVSYHKTTQKDFQQQWSTGSEAINHSEFQVDQKVYQNAISTIHASIPNSLLMNNQLGLYGCIDEYWFCCKIQYSEQDNKIKIILKDLSNRNEITRKLLIGYTELFSE